MTRGDTRQTLWPLSRIQKISLAAGLLFLLFNLIFIHREWYWGLLFPAVLLLVMIAFFSLDRLLLLVTFFIPLSVPLRFIMEEAPLDLYLPTEPLIFGIMLMFWLRFLAEPRSMPVFWKHPITLLVIIHLVWILFTALTSTMVVVSLKFFLARFWFISSFFFFGYQVFQSGKRIRQFMMLYALSLCVVVLYTLVRHSAEGLNDQQAAHSAVYPFYTDHTSYGAMIVFFLPALLAVMVIRKREKKPIFLHFIPLIILTVGLLFSYTRAAWLSGLAGLLVFFVFLFRIRLSVLLISIAAGLIVLVSSWSYLIMKLEENKQASSGDFAEHVQSISNISSDASNMERINRWSCALRMFREKPLLGWGPGTYQFQYAPFQRSADRTYISTNFGEIGNAHSEYLGPLAESGIPGFLSIVSIVAAALFTAHRTHRRSAPGNNRILNMAVLLSLVTYFSHGFLNNFLHTDKASGPVWAFMAVIIANDLAGRRSKLIKNHELPKSE